MLKRITSASFRKPLVLAALAIGMIGSVVKADDRYVPIPLASDPVQPSRQVIDTPNAPAGRLSIEQIGQALDANYPGKNTITNNGQTYYTVNIKQGTWNFHLVVSLSPNGNVLWLNAPLVKIEDPAAVSPTAMVDLLKKNNDLGPTFFQINGNSMLELTEPIANHDMTSDDVKGWIESFLKSIKDSEPKWNKEVLMPATGAPTANAQPAKTPTARPRNPLAAPTPAKNPLAAPRNPLAQ